MVKSSKVIGSGRTRVVYDLGNGYVLKVAKNKAGVSSNKNEFLLFHSKEFAPIRQHLAEIKQYGSHGLVMKKYTQPFRMTKKYIQKFIELRSKFKKNGIIPCDIWSRTHKGPSLTNLRLNHLGEIIVIDYGAFKFRDKHKK
jgi:hypothetical protein